MICVRVTWVRRVAFSHKYSAGRMGGVPDTAQLPRFRGGLGVVSGLGPGLTRYSADAAAGCLYNDPSAGSQVRAPTGAAG